MLLDLITEYILLAAIAAVALFAVWKGHWPERAGGLANLAAALCLFLVQALFGGPGDAATFGMILLALDGLLALCFLVLTVRFAAIWLGLAMLLQAAQFALHAFYFVVERRPDFLFAFVNNVVSWGVLAAITLGIVSSWVGDARASRAQPGAA